jgi:hypothetical protein
MINKGKKALLFALREEMAADGEWAEIFVAVAVDVVGFRGVVVCFIALGLGFGFWFWLAGEYGGLPLEWIWTWDWLGFGDWERIGTGEVEWRISEVMGLS